MENAQLRLAEKNLETSGNPPPSFKIMNAFTDPELVSILNDSGFKVGAESGELVSLIRAREDAQAALAAAAALAKAREASAMALVVSDPVGSAVVASRSADTRELEAIPSTSRAPAKKRVAKPVTSRGVRLRNRII